MKKISILYSFERSVKKLTSKEKVHLAKSLEVFNNHLVTNHAPYGFRFKKINHDKYEFRIDIRLRVVLKEERDTFYLVFVGNHDGMRRYLRNFR